MYTSYTWRILCLVKRLQIYIDEEVDDALAVEAARQKTSKAALIRECLGERLPVAREQSDEFVGWIDDELPDVGKIDDVVYGG